MPVVLRDVRDRKGYGLKAFVEGPLVAGDVMFEGTFRRTRTRVTLAPHEYGFTTSAPYDVLQPEGELRFHGIYGGYTFYHTDLTSIDTVPPQTIISPGP